MTRVRGAIVHGDGYARLMGLMSNGSDVTKYVRMRVWNQLVRLVVLIDMR